MNLFTTYTISDGNPLGPMLIYNPERELTTKDINELYKSTGDFYSEESLEELDNK